MRWLAMLLHRLAALFLSCTATAVPAQTAKPAATPPERAQACGACHGPDGNSPTANTPSIAGQPRLFLENYLVMTREGIRGSDVMQGLLKGLPDAELVGLSKHFSALPAKPAPGARDAKLFERGRQVAAANRCASCHEKTFRGREQMPRLAGQREDFLAQAMLQYRQNRRPGGDTIMAASLYGIAEADFKALAHYFAQLK